MQKLHHNDPIAMMLTSNRVDQEVGRTVYTLMLNQAGGIEADLTITRFKISWFDLCCDNNHLYHHEAEYRIYIVDRVPHI